MSSRDSYNDPAAKVYVGDLGSGGSKPELEKEFKRFGPLKSVWVARNPPGFAFVQFEDKRDAEDSVKEMDGKRVCGVRIRVEIARTRNGPYYGDRSRGGGGGRDDNSRYKYVLLVFFI